jgi:pimeloyl-ACP methyl ester carboxylesterase
VPAVPSLLSEGWSSIPTHHIEMFLNSAKSTINILRLSTTKMSARQFIHLALAIICFAAFAGCKTNSPSAPQHAATGKKFTYVLVHGAWGGGWDWKPVAQLLTADGNTVYRPTLTGLGEHSNLSSTNIDLDTHIQDIVNVILWEDLHDVVLVGHSYGGMVITGVADRVPGRIKHVVYIDALLPMNGERERDIRPRTSTHFVKDGLALPTWVANNTPPPHDVPQSDRTFSEPITLTNQATAQKLPTTYILTVDKGAQPEQDDFYRFYERAKARGWTALIMEGDHNVQRSHPKELVRLLEQAP